jgi:hypothetical protein
MIKAISYQLPQATEEEKNFFDYLSQLLKELPHCKIEKKRTILEAPFPTGTLPLTIFEPADISSPQIILDTQESIDLEVGNLYIRSVTAKHKIRVIEQGETLLKTKKQDNVGEYIEILSENKTFSLLSMDELFKRLKTHIVRIDHTGINIPTKVISKEQWDDFIKKVAPLSNLYRYPTGEPWLFILPATAKEQREDITDFRLGREPKFEIVYDDYSPIPTIQIDIESDLSREEVEKLLPPIWY